MLSLIVAINSNHSCYFLCFFVCQHNTIEAVLQRGEKLDDLVEKSEGLSTQSKAFYKTVSSNATFVYHSLTMTGYNSI